MASKNRGKRKISEGVAHIKATFNNTIITISDLSGNVLCQHSAGQAGFKGSRKGTPYAAQLAAEAAVQSAKENYDLRRVVVEVSGPGAGRDSAIRAVHSSGLEVIKLRDKTRLPHNGCRPRKRRRV